MARGKGPRYRKRCAKCGELFGPDTAGRLALRTFCSSLCAGAKPRSERTQRVEELARRGRLSQLEIAQAVGLSHQRVSFIIHRADGNPLKKR